MNGCPYCESGLLIDSPERLEFACGTRVTYTKTAVGTVLCRAGKAQRERDLAVDDAINRAREDRHFEPDHFGT